jgi:hypothetical protein
MNEIFKVASKEVDDANYTIAASREQADRTDDLGKRPHVKEAA